MIIQGQKTASRQERKARQGCPFVVGAASAAKDAVPTVVPRSQRGVALIAALFLLVALAALGIYMVTLSGVQQETPTRAMDASRAWYAARSGIEYAAYQAANPAGSGCDDDTITLDGFSVTITCSESTHTERGDEFQVFQLSATASRGTYGDRNYVARRAEGTVSNAP